MSANSERGGISFVKAHACGNDFLVVEESAAAPDSGLARRLCDRSRGVGADGVEFLRWTGERSGEIRLLNADGSAAEISGNGTRCVAAHMAWEKNAGAGEEIALTTDAGLRVCRIVAREGHRFRIASAMGRPEVREKMVKLADGGVVAGAEVSTGNPHFVIVVEDGSFRVRGHEWREIGAEICGHGDFPQQTNVEFVRLTGAAEIEIRIFERGAGPTMSSGTGTCASAAAAMALHGAARELTVKAPGGAQTVAWPDADAAMLLTGPAELIARGEAFRA